VTKQILARGLDVIHDQIKTLGRAGSRSGDILAEDDRAAGARRRELNHTKVFAVAVVGVESPPEPRVELLRAIDIRDWDNDDFEFHVDFRHARLACGVVGLDSMRRICHVLSSFCVQLKFFILPSSLWRISLLSVAKNGRSKLGTREPAIHHQLDRVDV
jgi:hypothetical protein